MFGLERDFVQQDGITMLLGKPEGLAAGELNMVQARMLMNTGIPHHLRLLLREIDLQVTLEYTVSRRKMLGALLKSERLSMLEFFGLLLQIAAGMEEGRLYMLRAEQYALHEDYIFIEGPLNSGKVFLTYLPLQHTESAVSPGESLRSLIMVFMAAIHELSGDGMQRLLQYCGEEAFSPAGLKELLAELLTGADQYRAPPEAMGLVQGKLASVSIRSADRMEQPPLRNLEEPKTAFPGRATFAWEQGDKDTVPPAPGQAPDQAPWMGGAPRLKRKDGGASGEQLMPDMPEQTLQAAVDGTSSYRTYIVLGAVLCDALLWKFLYLNNPLTLWLAVCAAVTLGLAVVCWMVWSGRITRGGSEEEEEFLEEGTEDRKGTGRKLRNELEWDFGRNPVAPLRPSAPTYTRSEQASSAAISYPKGTMAGGQGIAPETAEGRIHVKEAPAAVAATALLIREPEPVKGGGLASSGRAVPYLERSEADEGGTPERIELNRPSFIIGRSSEVAQYVETSEGASRVHAEISRSSGGYILKDLDSRNGTLLAGEVMVPYKEYPLTEGAVFTIVKGCYTFHT